MTGFSKPVARLETGVVCRKCGYFVVSRHNEYNTICGGCSETMIAPDNTVHELHPQHGWVPEPNAMIITQAVDLVPEPQPLQPEKEETP